MDTLSRPRQSWPQDFGNALAEYQAITERVGFAPFPADGALIVSGTKSESFVNDVMSNAVPTRTGAGCRSLLLGPDGSIRFDVCVSKLDSGRFLLTGSGNIGAALCEFLSNLPGGRDITLELAGEQWGRFGVGGPDAEALLGKLLALDRLPSSEGEVYLLEQGWLVKTDRSGQVLWEWFFPVEQMDEQESRLSALGVIKVGCSAFGRVQLSQGRFFQRHIAGRYPDACGLQHLCTTERLCSDKKLLGLVSHKKLEEGMSVISNGAQVGEVLSCIQAPALGKNHLVIVEIESQCTEKLLVNDIELTGLVFPLLPVT